MTRADGSPDSGANPQYMTSGGLPGEHVAAVASPTRRQPTS
jgi:hypothetical protein